jgi:prepilin-type N-terminal cleavage/methylation domain-containing protein
MQKTKKGFTLIELMIAIAIIGIIAAISASLYNQHIARQMVIKAMGAGAYLQQAVEDYYQLYGYLPGSGDLTTGPGGPYISGYTLGTNDKPQYNNPATDILGLSYWNDTQTCSSGVSNCDGTGSSQRRQIEIGFTSPTSAASGLLSGKIFILRANLNSGVVTWICKPYDVGDSSAWLDNNLLPTTCRE